MATMVALILNKGESVSKTYAGANSFTDCVGHWASGAIALASAQGIISGVGNGKFNPDAPVTGAQASRMLVSALGYDTKSEGIGGAQWATKAVAVAKKAGLLDGLDTMNVNAVLTRDQACQMMFNALKADMVEYETKATSVDLGTIGSINVGGSTAKSMEKKDGNYAGVNGDGKDYKQLCEEYFPDLTMKKTADDDGFGTMGNKWTYKKGAKNESVGPYAPEPDFVYTADMDFDDIEDDLADYFPAEGLAADVTIVKATSGSLDKTAKLLKGTMAGKDDVTGGGLKTIAGLTDDGVVVSVYTEDDAVSHITVCTPGVKTVKVKEVKATSSRGAYTEYKLDGIATPLKVFSTIVDEDKDEDTAVITGDVKDGDYVTYYQDGGSPVKYHIFATTEVTGVITRKSGSELTISGTKYTLNTVANAKDYTTSKSDETTVALDQYGYVVAKVEGDDDTLYGMVLSVDDVNVATSGNRYKSAKCFTVATTEGKVVELNVENKADKINGATDGSVISYEADGDYYELTVIKTSDHTTDQLISEFDGIEKDKTTLKNATGGGPEFAGNSTLYVFANWDDDETDGTVTTYTGYKNVPSYDKETNKFVALDTKSESDRNGVATVVFVYDDVKGSTDGDFVYLTGYLFDEDDTAMAQAIVNGEEKDLDISSMKKENWAALGLENGESDIGDGVMLSNVKVSNGKITHKGDGDYKAPTEYAKIELDGTVRYTEKKEGAKVKGGEPKSDAMLYVITDTGNDDTDVEVASEALSEIQDETYEVTKDSDEKNIYIDLDGDDINAIYVIVRR